MSYITFSYGASRFFISKVFMAYKCQLQPLSLWASVALQNSSYTSHINTLKITNLHSKS